MTDGEEPLQDLLRKVADRVDDVVSAEERVRALLDAVLAIGGDLDLRATFQRVVEAAAALVNARYAALGVIDRTGEGLALFVTHGISDELREYIGPEPHGRGILGRLIRDPKPLRLTDLQKHPDAVGFPEGHPEMRSFLGVPVKVGNRVFGNLYLTEKVGGDFTAEDETSIVALAAAAGVAVENARLFEQTERGRRSFAATAEILRSLLSHVDQKATLDLVAARAHQVSDADLAFLLLEDAAQRLRVVAVSGEAEDMLDTVVPREGPIIDVVAHGATVRLAEGLQIEGAAGMSSSLLVPFAGPAGAAGALVVAIRDSRGVVWPEDEDVDAMRGFADQAALALERAQSRQDREDLAVLSDRDRIARDLHDLVIQRLFATGLSLQGVSRRVDQDDVRERIRLAVEDLDTTIKEIRGAIFELSKPAGVGDLRSQLREVVQAAGSSSGLMPHLELIGPVESAVPEEVRPHLVAVLVEALSNAVRHAGASEVNATVEVGDGRVSLEVADDGRGFSATGHESGVRNMRSRALSVSGGCVIDSVDGEGTTVRWWAPLGDSAASG